MKDQNYINRVKARWADVYPDLIDVANRVVEERRAANKGFPMSITERFGRSVIIWMSIGCAVTRRWSSTM